ncbi:TetR/AcrR family transcriptional regulator [candidate division CSSED10-310 bacterium]|uniref:TetR/AcrR family transcriptional regulator n=1 Tax=candidate division CSSED10-310 bacterium TaxID=2855610 RepID=A0ABV6YYJ1_UNCC1
MGIAERRLREKKQRRTDIVDAAERIFFSKGWDNATMEDVAEEAELSKGTLYLYFKTKEDLYLAIHLRGLKILETLFHQAVLNQANGFEKVKAIGQAYFAFAGQYPDYFNALSYYEMRELDFEDEDSPAAECARQGQITNYILVSALQEGIDDGSIRADIDPLMMTMVLWGQTTGLIQIASRKEQLIKQKYGVNIEDLFTFYFDFMHAALEA